MSPEDACVVINFWDDCDALECPVCHRDLCAVNGKTLEELLAVSRKHMEEEHG